MSTQISLTPRFSGVGQRQERKLTVSTVFQHDALIRAFRFALTAISFILLPSSVHACAACYGQSDSPLASGVTWGILSLLVVVMGVLGSIVTFFVYINKKSAAAVASQAFPTAPLTHHASRITSLPSSVTNH